jgi:uncharacterized membrane protein
MIATLPKGFVTAVAATGVVAAGAIVLEAALVPGLVLGAAAVLAPQFLPKRRRGKAKKTGPSLRDMFPKSLDDLTHLRFSQSVVKTITFRVIVTTLDFTANYLILQEPTTAAGLSAISIVGGPLFYFTHETAWNYLVGTGKVSTLRLPGVLGRNPALVKTITYRTFATIVEFTTNYVVVGDVATAALLSSFGFFLGPFVYYGHERAWERFGPKTAETVAGGTPRRWASGRPPVIIDVEPVPVPSS